MYAKRITSLALALLLMFSLAGCGILDSLRSLGSPFQKVEADTFQTDHDCTGVVVGDAVHCYSERNGSTPVMTVSAGTTVNIYYREYIGEENWVFTDHGWIYGDCVQTLSEASGNEEGLGGVIYGGNTMVYIEPYLNAEVCTQFTEGTRVVIYYLSGTDSMMWAFTAEGWVPMEYIFLDNAPEPGCVPVAFHPELSVLMDSALSNGELYLTGLMESQGILWGEIGHSYWISMDFLVFHAQIQIFLQDGSLFEPDLNRELTNLTPNFVFPNGSIGGYVPNEPETPTEGNEPTHNTDPTTGTEPSAGNGPQPPKDTSLVGTWVRFDPDAFLAYGAVNPMNWIFYADGTFYTGGCEYMYMYDQGGWYGASGGWGYGGNYFYDGNELVLEYTHFIGDDGSSDSYRNTERYSCRVDGDTVTFGDTTLCRGEEVNPAVHSCIQSNAASRVRSDLVGTWNGNNGTTLTLNADGTFSESGSGSYTGWFLFRDESLYLAYQGRGGFIGMFNISVGDGTLTCQTIYQWETLTIQYTR